MSAFLRNVQPRTELHQHLDGVDGFVLKRAYDRDTAEAVLRVGVRAVFEQDPRHVCARASHAGVVQRSVADDVGNVWWCPMFEEVLQRTDVVRRAGRLVEEPLCTEERERGISMLVSGLASC